MEESVKIESCPANNNNNNNNKVTCRPRCSVVVVPAHEVRPDHGVGLAGGGGDVPGHGRQTHEHLLTDVRCQRHVGRDAHGAGGGHNLQREGKSAPILLALCQECVAYKKTSIQKNVYAFYSTRQNYKNCFMYVTY
jgi:hypothetical protein